MSTEGTTGMLDLHFVHATYARCECATVGGIQHGRRTVPDGTAATGPDGPNVAGNVSCQIESCVASATIQNKVKREKLDEICGEHIGSLICFEFLQIKPYHSTAEETVGTVGFFGLCKGFILFGSFRNTRQ
jgi:hypothetical protein